MNWLWLILAVVVFWCLGDAAYAIVIRWRQRRWERRQTWTAEGIRAGCTAFSLGHGQDGIAILMVHGYADNPGLFRKMAGRLAAEHGWTCRALRLPGAAEPLDQANAKADLALWRQAIDAEIAVLTASHRHVWLLGHSMGAALAADAVCRQPESIAGLVMLAPLVKVSAAKSPLGVPPRCWYRLLRHTLVFSRTAENWLAPVNAAGETYLDRFVGVRYFDQVFSLIDQLAASRLPTRLPVLLVVAGRDRVVDSAAALAWVARQPVAILKTKCEAEMGHVLPVEDGWERVAAETARFIRLE